MSRLACLNRHLLLAMRDLGGWSPMVVVHNCIHNVLESRFVSFKPNAFSHWNGFLLLGVAFLHSGCLRQNDNDTLTNAEIVGFGPFKLTSREVDHVEKSATLESCRLRSVHPEM